MLTTVDTDFEELAYAAEQRLRGLRLRAASPFFATLLLYARLLPTRHVEVAATDGADIFFNPAGIMRYGPHELTSVADALPPAQGGGGTSFVPFFAEMPRQYPAPAVLVYLTDGYGEFPAGAPATPVLWVVAPGGASFPFGEVLRLV